MLVMSRFDIMKFLSFYHQFPCLWDKYDPEFKVALKRTEAEETLLSIFNVPSRKELKAKIRSIRCTYNQEVAKIKKSIIQGRLYKPKLFWFDYADSFLKKNRGDEEEINLDTITYDGQCDTSVECQQFDDSFEVWEKDERVQFHKEVTGFVHHEGNIKKENNQNQDIQVSSVECQVFDDEPEFIQKKEETFQVMAPVQQKPVISPKTVPKNSKNINPKKNDERNKQIKIDSMFEEVVSNLKSVANQGVDDEFAIFGKHVGIQLSKLPLATALRVEGEIHEILMKARLSELQS